LCPTRRTQMHVYYVYIPYRFPTTYSVIKFFD
jgi:hypothetical protein